MIGFGIGYWIGWLTFLSYLPIIGKINLHLCDKIDLNKIIIESSLKFYSLSCIKFSTVTKFIQFLLYIFVISDLFSSKTIALVVIMNEIFSLITHLIFTSLWRFSLLILTSCSLMSWQWDENIVPIDWGFIEIRVFDNIWWAILFSFCFFSHSLIHSIHVLSADKLFLRKFIVISVSFLSH